MGQTERPLAMAPEFIHTACPGFFGSYSFWMKTLLSPVIIGTALYLPPSNVPYRIQRVVKRWGWRYVERMGEGEEVETWINMYNKER